jgi:aromatic ring-cleaving dioxygenase
MKKTLFLVLVFVLLFSFSINAQTNKIPVEIIENFQNDGEGTLARLFTYEIKERIRNSKTMQLNNGSGKRIALLVTTLPHNDFSNNVFIYSVSWLMINPSSSELPAFVNSTLGYAGKDVYEEYAKSIFIQTEDLFRDIM